MAEIRVPQQVRAQRTREKLLEAAQRELSARGYAKATARSIASEAGVATGSFYQYFADKDAVLRELGTTRLARISQLSLGLLDSAADPRDTMRTVVLAVMAYHREDPGLHAVLTERRAHDPELDMLTTKGEHALIDAVQSMLERWSYPGDREATAFILFSMVEGAIHAHCLGHALVSDERFVDTLIDALVKIALP